MPEFVDSEPDLLISENTPLLNDNNDLANTVVDSIRESKSSTAETIANILNLLMGMGILSLPFAFFKLGWFLSIGFILMFAIMAFYTGTLISTILSMNENVKSMYEMVDAAFSLRGRMVFGFVFMLELFTASIAMIILFADSIIMLFPELADYKTGLMVGAVLLLTPLTMMDSFKSLAVFSYLGLVSIIFLVLTVVALVLSNLETSIIPPATTSAWPRDFSQVGLGIGLLFVGFDGHSVFPSLNTQMRHSNRFPVSLGVSYLVVFLVYLLVGTLGYTMFGNDVEPEITFNIIATEFSPFLVKMTLLMFAFNPLTKYSLLVKPITSTLESIAGITGKTHIVGLRISVNASILLFACLCPAFHRVMGFIGAALSFTIVTITPTACYLKLNPNGHILKRMTCWTVLVFGSFFMVFSTVAIVMYNK